MELIQDAANKTRVDKALKLVEPLQIVWPTQAECRWAMEVFRAFHLSHGLGLLDSLMAACAVGREAALLTFNGKHYRPLPELKIEEPYARA